MNRLTSFNDVVGHDWLVEYFMTHLRNNTVPQFIILVGPEGLDKTSLADLIAINLVYGLEDSEEKREAIETVVNQHKTNDYIKRYKCSVEGGREVAKEVLSEITNGFMLNRKKVVLCDECHNLSAEAQDVFLSDTEFMKKDVYLFMMTTDVQKLRASLVSRAVKLHLYPVKHADMMSVLKREVAYRHLNVQNEDATLSLICDWSECKPRTGLSMLNAFADGDAISSNTIRDMIGVLDVMDILPVLESLSASMSYGLNFIADMPISDSMVTLVSECFKIKTGNPSYKVQFNQVSEIKRRLHEVSEQQLIKFLHGITRQEHVSRSGIINAFLSAHRSFDVLAEPNTEHMLPQELDQKAEIGGHDEFSVNMVESPTIESLLANADVVRR